MKLRCWKTVSALFVMYAATAMAAPAQTSGTVSFAPPEIIPFLPFTYGIAAGDFNNDGIQDLSVVSIKGSDISVGLGIGNGTFGAWISTFASNAPSLLAVGKFDGQNLSAAVNDGEQMNAAVMLGDGTGNFPNVAFLDIGGLYANGFAVADFNGDDKLDIAVAGLATSGAGKVFIFLGNGDGTFSGPTTFSCGGQGIGLMVAGDFNGDNIPDLAILNYGTSQVPGNIAVLLGNGDGTFQPPKVRHFPKGFLAFGSGIAAGDFKGDGNLDLVVTGFSGGRGAVVVLLGQGDGTFKRGAVLNAGPGPQAVAVADFNGDGKPDLVVVGDEYQSFNGYMAILLGNGDGTFQPASFFSLGGEGPQQITVADFNGDGKPDVATANAVSGNISVMLNTTVLPNRASSH